jgi:glycosyltransferase involved in cell wall biosynthesis
MISLAIPTYNHAHLIPKLLQSCVDAGPLVREILVCDDCSTDETPKVLESWASRVPHLKLFRNARNLGVTRTVNFLVSEVTAPDFLHIASDDWFFPERLTELYNWKQSNALDVCFGKYCHEVTGNLQAFVHRGWAQGSYANKRDEFATLISHDLYMFLGAALFSTKLFSERPFFDVGLEEAIEFGDSKTFRALDFDLMLGLSQRSDVSFGFLDEYVSVFRIDDGQLSSAKNYDLTGRAAVEYAELILRHLSSETSARLRPFLAQMRELLLYKCMRYEEHVEQQGLVANRGYTDKVRQGLRALNEATGS